MPSWRWPTGSSNNASCPRLPAASRSRASAASWWCRPAWAARHCSTSHWVRSAPGAGPTRPSTCRAPSGAWQLNRLWALASTTDRGWGAGWMESSRCCSWRNSGPSRPSTALTHAASRALRSPSRNRATRAGSALAGLFAAALATEAQATARPASAALKIGKSRARGENGDGIACMSRNRARRPPAARPNLRAIPPPLSGPCPPPPAQHPQESW